MTIYFQNQVHWSFHCDIATDTNSKRSVVYAAQ